MKLEDVLHQVLGVQAPWQIVNVRNDLGRGQIDVWLSKSAARSGWFFGGRTAQPAGNEQVWRHVNVGDCRCVIHSPLPDDSAPPSWSGEPSLPFTYAMSRLIASMMRDGIRLQTICDLLDVAVGDIWKFKHTLDSGKACLSASAPGDQKTSASRVPEPAHPVWSELLEGSVNLDIKLLSLKLLLAKLREQMRVISDPEVRVLKTYELQRYFQRYEAALDHELLQLENLL